MGDRTEVIVTSELSGVLSTACIWDSRSGTALMNYKGGGTTGKHCMSIVGNDYLFCAEKTKPIIHVWPLNSQETTRSVERVVTPGCVSALCVSPKNNYCIVAVAEKLYIWDLIGGQLLTVTNRHFRSITCVKFTDDGSHFISCGQDGMVIVWPLAHLVAHHANEYLLQVEAGQPEPRYTFSDHSLPVTDLHVGFGGMQALVATVSGDQTCKIYSLADGVLLLSIVFNCSLSAVTMSANGLEVFIGSINGDIFSFNMHHMPRLLDYHLTQKEISQKFVGHTKAVTSLSASLDGFRLISGSVDERVIIWDIKSRQCMKVLQHKGSVSNAFLTVTPKHVFSSVFKPSTVIVNFKKAKENKNSYITFIKKDGFVEKEIPRKIMRNSNKVRSLVKTRNLEQPEDEMEEVVQLKEVNKKLYKFAVSKLLKN